MVDINLFDDDEEKGGQREKEWDSTLGKKEDLKADAFKDELSLDDDLGEHPSLGDETLLGEEEVVPELKEPEGKEEDYGYGDVKKKKTPAYHYVILVLAVFVLFACVYFFILPKINSVNRIKSVDSLKKPSLTYQSPVNKQPVGISDSVKSLRSKSGTSICLIDAAKSVFDDLIKQEQFGAVLLDGERFAVEYVSTIPRVSQQMGKRIQMILGATDFKASPEERHTLDGKVTYWGVISGTIRKKFDLIQNTPIKFATYEQFVEQMKGTARQNNLSSVDVKKQPSTGFGDSRLTGFRIRVEGRRMEAMTWLEQLKKYQPNCNVKILFLVPLEYYDQKASRIKLVLDLSVSLG